MCKTWSNTLGMNKESKIFVAGHKGLVGSAIVRKLKAKGYGNLICRTHREMDLCNQQLVLDFFKTEKPEYVFMGAARVGGIKANDDYRADIIYSNLQIQVNVIQAAYLNKVKKLLFLGSSCIYPKYCPQPMKEEHLLSGYLEPTNDAYAIAKISGILMCQSYNRQYGTNYISVMPTNLYGPNDNYDLEKSHVLPALIRKFHEAKVKGLKEVVVWGSGSPTRDFLYVDDLADACLFLMNNYDDNEIVNIGTGLEITIKDLAELIKKIVGYSGKIVFDQTKPDGTPLKILDVGKLINMGWTFKTGLEEGIGKAYEAFKETISDST